jgi:hypothetical protein
MRQQALMLSFPVGAILGYRDWFAASMAPPAMTDLSPHPSAMLKETSDCSRRFGVAPGAAALALAAPPRNTGGLAEIGDNPDEWVNVCVADTYDVEAVVAK